MYGIIYKAVSTSGKIYIGQTIRTLPHRKAAHAYRTKKGDRRNSFHVALLNEGFSSFTWEQIDTAESKEELNAKEKHWIAFYKSDDPAFGFNGTEGGIFYKPTFEHRQNMSKSIKGKTRPDMKGKPCPHEVRQKISEALKGHGMSEETRRRISEANRGNKKPPRSAEHRKAISEANKRRKPVTEETRRKLSETAKRRWGNRI